MTTLFANPYEAPNTESLVDVHPTRERFAMLPRLDWFTGSVLASSFASAIGIYLYFTQGISSIGDPILAPLAAQTIVWIPIYRMATPALVLFMPQTSRRAFGLFHLVISIGACVNDFGGVYFGEWVFVSAIGLIPSFLFCVTLGIAVFAYELWKAERRTQVIVHGFGWLAITLGLQTMFWMIGMAA